MMQIDTSRGTPAPDANQADTRAPSILITTYQVRLKFSAAGTVYTVYRSLDGDLAFIQAQSDAENVVIAIPTKAVPALIAALELL